MTSETTTIWPSKSMARDVLQTDYYCAKGVAELSSLIPRSHDSYHYKVICAQSF